jgi:hypothetical protein
MNLKSFLAISAIFLGLALLVTRPGHNMYVPDDMIGQWTTSSPKYSDRYFELSKVSVVFGTGGDSIATNFVTQVEERVKNGTTETIIEYKNTKGESGRLCLFWEPSENGRIRLKNQEEIVWRRTPQAF